MLPDFRWISTQDTLIKDRLDKHKIMYKYSGFKKKQTKPKKKHFKGIHNCKRKEMLLEVHLFNIQSSRVFEQVLVFFKSMSSSTYFII